MPSYPWTPGLFVPNRRRIGGVAAQVTIEERERDELFITEHPIEQGAPINDHAFKRPSEVNIRAGWTTAGAGDLSATGSGAYGFLLSLQAALEPFDLYTGKRVYPNMLIQSLVVSTTKESEFALMAEITCRQVIIVRTQTAQTATSSNPENQKESDKTAGGSDSGDKAPREVGSGDTDLQAGGGPTSGDTDLQAGGGPTSGDTDLRAGVTSEGTKVESAVISNTSITGKGFTSTGDAIFSVGIPQTPGLPPGAPT